ncbi:MAG: RagB/SusD family nutrient uptake outer membrane protein [Cyclobacteriaceae bacterium]|nr:RagB/SusD family nutrient uptake outer membrane protein [Cyclobacteriaceae bacterium]
MNAIIHNHFKCRITRILLIVTLGLLISSCADFIEIDSPKTEIVSASVYNNDASAIAAIRGIYSLMVTGQSFANGQLERYTGLSSDELQNHSLNAEQQQFFFPALQAQNSVVLNVFWKEAYRYINNANAMLEALPASEGLSDPVRKQLEGEAKFVRAFCHFYLVNLFGDVPYIATSDYRINATAKRMKKEEVFAHMIDDLLDAEELLSNDFASSGNQRTQPNKFAAAALLSRVFLYTKEWMKAEEYASKVISQSIHFTMQTDLTQVFLATSKETIWQLQPVIPEKSTGQARLFILTASPTQSGAPGVSLQDAFIASFETGDERLDAWVGTYQSGAGTWWFPYKYKTYSSSTIIENAVALRLAEQYLIRAEARAQLDQLNESIEDIDVIRLRAGLPALMDVIPQLSKEEIVKAIEQERKIELFAEWGHRWLDLKRTDRVNDILSSTKADWQSHDQLYPIPFSEILVNPQLDQNTGY